MQESVHVQYITLARNERVPIRFQNVE